MSQFFGRPDRFLLRLRAEGLGRRTVGLLLVLLIHGLLALLFLTIAPRFTQETVKAMISFDVAAPSETPQQEESPEEVARPEPAEERPVPPEPQPTPEPPVIEVPPEVVPTPQTVTPPAPPAPKRPMMGPPDLRSALDKSGGDSERVEGSGPNGEPLYAAAWHRRPYDDELRGFLSTADGPGWGLIACRTVPDYRVEDCVVLDEYPSGSRIGRAVLAASWQFRVRPPQIGGRPQVGEWVRIRIDYGIKVRAY